MFKDLRPEPLLPDQARSVLRSRLLRASKFPVSSLVDQVIAPSRYVHARLVREGVRAGKVITIHNGVNVGKFRNAGPAEDVRGRYGVAPGRMLVPSISQLIPEKGIGDLIAAGALVLERGRDVSFIHVGGGRCAAEYPRPSPGTRWARAFGDGAGAAPTGYERTELYRHMVEDVLMLDQGLVYIALHPIVKAVARAYVGERFQLTEAKGWRSLATTKDFHGWHGDDWYDQASIRDVPREIKMASYLSDVDTGADSVGSLLPWGAMWRSFSGSLG